jgi:hypothetical protein
MNSSTTADSNNGNGDITSTNRNNDDESGHSPQAEESDNKSDDNNSVSDDDDDSNDEHLFDIDDDMDEVLNAIVTGNADDDEKLVQALNALRPEAAECNNLTELKYHIDKFRKVLLEFWKVVLKPRAVTKRKLTPRQMKSRDKLKATLLFPTDPTCVQSVYDLLLEILATGGDLNAKDKDIKANLALMNDTLKEHRGKELPKWSTLKSIRDELGVQ